MRTTKTIALLLAFAICVPITATAGHRAPKGYSFRQVLRKTKTRPPAHRPQVRYHYVTPNPFYPHPYFYGPPSRGYYSGYAAGAALRKRLLGR